MLYLTQEPTSSTVFSHTSQVNSALTDLLLSIGKISSSGNNEPGT